MKMAGCGGETRASDVLLVLFYPRCVTSWAFCPAGTVEDVAKRKLPRQLPTAFHNKSVTEIWPAIIDCGRPGAITQLCNCCARVAARGRCSNRKTCPSCQQGELCNLTDFTRRVSPSTGLNDLLWYYRVWMLYSTDLKSFKSR
jgi:hypothetical protein